MPTSVVYKGSADRRIVTREDLEKSGAKSFAADFQDLIFLKGVPQEVNNEYAEELTRGEYFPYFENASGDEKPPAEQLTDSAAAKKGAKVNGGGDGTDTAAATTSSSTGTGTTASSTSR